MAAAIPLMVASTAVSAIGQLAKGQMANAQAKYAATIAERNSAASVEAYRESRGIAVDERRDFWRKVGQIKGQNIAAMAANGIDVDFGSAGRLQEDTQMLANEDFTSLTRNQEAQQRAYLIDASNYTAEAKAQRFQGKQAVIGSYFGAASTVLGGLSQAALMNKPVG